jgi:hypothetical protein
MKQDINDGGVLDIISLEKGKDPDPHGMDMYQGRMYFSDAGIAPPGIPSGSAAAGYIYRIEADQRS